MNRQTEKAFETFFFFFLLRFCLFLKAHKYIFSTEKIFKLIMKAGELNEHDEQKKKRKIRSEAALVTGNKMKMFQARQFTGEETSRKKKKSESENI